VGEGLGDDPAPRTPLQRVITDGRRRREPLLEVALLEQVPLALRKVSPEAGERPSFCRWEYKQAGWGSLVLPDT
jgi:hypothetical protein